MIKNDKKTIRAWCMYDWANSVYSLTITTAVFPSYFFGVTGGKGAEVNFLGISNINTVIYSYVLSASFLIIALLNPFLSAAADYGGLKKRFMQFFCYLGALSCGLMFFFDAQNIDFGLILFGLAAIGYAGSLVFYNAYLPEIATEDRFDRISARGYALGYVGSVILLIFNLLLIQKKEWFGIPENENLLAAKISFLSVGIWWFIFAQITFRRLPSNVFGKKDRAGIFRKGFNELKTVGNRIRTLGLLRKFLTAFLFYSMGVQTVMYMATLFGEEVVNLETAELILLVLILQLVAVPGAYLFARISEKKGNTAALMISVAVWIGICVFAYFVKAGWKTEFYILGVVVGLLMGGIQALSRSTYSKLIPNDTKDHASYFSFYELIEKIAVAAGAFVFGLVKQLTGSMNHSALALGVLFIIGFVLLLRIPSKKTYAVKVNTKEE